MRKLCTAMVMAGFIAGPVGAATTISVTPPPAAAKADQPASGEQRNIVPPAAIAGLTGLVVLGLVFGRRRPGLPEVSS